MKCKDHSSMNTLLEVAQSDDTFMFAINQDGLNYEPRFWGQLMHDILEHLSEAYQHVGLSEKEARSAILDQFREEVERHASEALVAGNANADEVH